MIEPTTQPQIEPERSAQGEGTPALSWSELVRMARQAWAQFGMLLEDPRAVTVALLLILAIGAAFRFTGLNWDEHQHLHPDERFLTMVENSLEWPKSLKEYFDTSVNPLNPYNRGQGTYVYGLFPVVLAKFLGQLTGKVGYDGVYLVGRVMNGILDLFCVLLVFYSGRRLYDARAGLLGALLLSLSVLNIQQAHYFTVDTTTTFFVTLAMYLAVRVAQGGKWGAVALMGVAFGMAVSSKISVLTFGLIVGLALLLRAFASRDQTEPDCAHSLPSWRGRLGRLRLAFEVQAVEGCGQLSWLERIAPKLAAAGLALVGVLIVAFFTFRIAQPQAFQGPGFFGLKLNSNWKDNMQYISKLVGGELDYPPSHQWTNRPAVWFMLKNMVLWGQGLPLGLATWAAWALMGWQLIKRRRWAHLLPWVWFSMTFGYQSIQFVKVTRYLLPIYPTAALMAGFGLIWLWDRAREPKSGAAWLRWGQRIAAVALAFVVAGTAIWALAFTSIYTRPVSRAAASRWMYSNLPRGATISFELWDDPLPLNIDGHLASAEFQQIQFDLYWEDVPDKREKLYEWLQQTDHIALSSNRLYESIPRLPTRYPMTTRYYEALFSGELGYDLVQTFTSRPRFLGIEIVDDGADESFTVYDHPKVLLFQKRDDFDIAKVHALFDEFELDRIVRVQPTKYEKVPTNLMMAEETAILQRAGGTWSDMFDRDSLANRFPTLTWVSVLLLIGLVAFPMTFVAFSPLRDRGYALGKTVGLLILGYISWLLPSLEWLPYTRALIALVLAAMALVSAGIAWRQREAIQRYLQMRWRLLLSIEILFWCFFAVFWLIRYGNPDLWHPVMGGEKPMDLAYLNAIIKSSYFPPYDPWFAGGYLNYYYYGWVMVATLTKLTGVVPTTAYNLAIPTCFAMLALGVSTTVFNLVPSRDDEATWFPRALRFGVLGAFLVAVMGNLGEVRLLLQGLQGLGQAAQFQSTIPGLSKLVQTLAGLYELLFKGRQLPFRPEWWYWNASRIMEHGEINEFPFFTFLYADLHAHLTAMPFAALVLGLATSLVVKPVAALSQLARDRAIVQRAQGLWGRCLERLDRVDWALWARLGLLGLAVGELWCNNSWDYPTYLLVSLMAIALGLHGEVVRRGENPWTWRNLLTLSVRAGAVVLLSMALFRPYHASFGLGYSSIERWKGERTPLGAYLMIHGTQLFVLVSYLLVTAFRRESRNALVRAMRLFARPADKRRRAGDLYARLVRCQSLGYELAWVGIALLGLMLVLFILTKSWVLFLGVPVLVLAAALVLDPEADASQRLVRALVALGMGLTLAVEYIVLKGDIGRMNTVFKFYLQVWVIWGVAAAVWLSSLLPQSPTWRPGWGRAWRWGVCLLIVGGALYPVGATYGKVRDRWDATLPSGLDGTMYMTTAHYQDNGRDLPLINDLRAITWLQENIEGSPVIVEANTPLYRWGGRVSIYTGLPSVIGWDWHQKQQRAAVDGIVVDWRLQDLRDLYSTLDQELALRILERYDVGLIYVGDLERAYYDAAALEKFEQMVSGPLDVIYRESGVTIYRVQGSSVRLVSQSEGEQGPLAAWWSRHWIPASVRAQGPEKAPSGNLVEIERPQADLMLDVPVGDLPVVDDARGWNRWLGDSTLGIALCWWLVLMLIGLAVWPLVATVLPGFADRGYALSKGMGLLIVGYGVWIGSSLRFWPNTALTAWIVLLALGGCSFFSWAGGGVV